MSRKQRVASWAVALAAICGLGTSVLQYLTNRDTDHESAAGTITAVASTRWGAHDREHDREHFDSVRRLGVMRDVYEDIADLRAAVKACRNQIELLSKGRPNAARRDLASTELLLIERDAVIDRINVSMPRAKIMDMRIELTEDTIQQAAQETYK